MDSSSKFFFSFSVNYAMIVKLVDLIVLLGSKSLNRFRKIFNTRHLSMLRVVRWGIPRFMMGIWYGTLLVSE